MTSENDNCPTCNDRAKSAITPDNAGMVARPWTPPTADELEFTRQVYDNRGARMNSGSIDGQALTRTNTDVRVAEIRSLEATPRELHNRQTEARHARQGDRQFMTEPEQLRYLPTESRRLTGVSSDGITLPDYGGLPADPQAPAVRTTHVAEQAIQANRLGIPSYCYDPRLPLDSVVAGEVLIRSRLAAPWHFQVNDEVDDEDGGLEEWGKEAKKHCEDLKRDCIAEARLAHTAGEINDRELNKRVRECESEYEECLDAFYRPILELARLARGSRKVKEEVEDAKDAHDDCIDRANKIADEDEREQALAKCYDDLKLTLERLTNFAPLISSSVWDKVNDIFLPKKERECPCCVVGKDSIKVNTEGGLEGADSMKDYADWPENFPDPPAGFWENAGLVGSLVTRAAFAVEISAQWKDHTKCECECEWTQFVKAEGGSWYEDRAGFAPAPDSEEARENREKWKKICKGDRLYIGDLIMRAIDQRTDQEVFYFRTIFFSSATNCQVQYAYVDWKLRFFRESFTGNLKAEFAELGRGEG